MAQGKVYRNCSNLTTPPAIQDQKCQQLGEGQAGEKSHDSPDATGHSGLRGVCQNT